MGPRHLCNKFGGIEEMKKILSVVFFIFAVVGSSAAFGQLPEARTISVVCDRNAECIGSVVTAHVTTAICGCVLEPSVLFEYRVDGSSLTQARTDFTGQLDIEIPIVGECGSKITIEVVRKDNPKYPDGVWAHDSVLVACIDINVRAGKGEGSWEIYASKKELPCSNYLVWSFGDVCFYAGKSGVFQVGCISAEENNCESRKDTTLSNGFYGFGVSGRMSSQAEYGSTRHSNGFRVEGKTIYFVDCVSQNSDGILPDYIKVEEITYFNLNAQLHSGTNSVSSSNAAIVVSLPNKDSRCIFGSSSGGNDTYLHCGDNGNGVIRTSLLPAVSTIQLEEQWEAFGAGSSSASFGFSFNGTNPTAGADGNWDCNLTTEVRAGCE